MTRNKPLWLWFALLGMAWLAWRVLSLGLADHYAETDPQRALAWRDDHPLALFRAAEQAAADPARAEEAADLARRALRSDPLDGRPYRVLANLALDKGDRETALDLFTVAANRAPRDPAAHVFLIEHHLRGNRPLQALQHLDTLLRVHPREMRRFEPLLVALASTPAAHEALAEVLAKQPPWRGGMLQMASTKATDLDGVAPLFDALRRSEGGLSDNELAPWLDRLVREGRVGQAYLLWVSNLPPERLASVGNIFNGSFEEPPEPLGFGWRFGRVAGARIERLGGPGVVGERALRVAFEYRRVPFNHVRQMLAVPPGRYRLALQARADGLRTGPGLVWEVSCVSGGKPLARTPPLRGQTPWHQLDVEFDIPEGCNGQWLVLRLPARIEAEQQIGGRAWFDDLKLTRIP